MTNAEKIRSLGTWELAEFIFKVSNGATKITNCTNECAKCEFSDEWCISEIGEWLNEKTDDIDKNRVEAARQMKFLK